MKKLSLLIALLLCLFIVLQSGAFAIKPVADPWEYPESHEPDGSLYVLNGDDGYVVVWETPECDVKGEYLLLENGTEIIVDYRIKYLENDAWGHCTVELEPDENGESKSFSGWVLMRDLVSENELNVVLPAVAVPATEDITPPTPEEAITVVYTYNKAIVYTSVAIAVVALALAGYVFAKHKVLNKKGE